MDPPRVSLIYLPTSGNPECYSTTLSSYIPMLVYCIGQRDDKLNTEVLAGVLAGCSDIFQIMKRIAVAIVAVSLSLLAASCTGEVLTLEVGTCFDDPESFEEVTDVPQVECTEPHDNEVIALRQLDNASFPGHEAVAARADALCVAAFDDYIGVPYESSQYAFGWLVPTEDSWSSGDREVICFVYDPSLAKITGSVRGTAV